MHQLRVHLPWTHRRLFLQLFWRAQVRIRLQSSDNGTGERTCVTSKRTSVWSLSTQVKIQAWVQAPVTPALRGHNQPSQYFELLFNGRPYIKAIGRKGCRGHTSGSSLCVCKPHAFYIHSHIKNPKPCPYSHRFFQPSHFIRHVSLCSRQ